MEYGIFNLHWLVQQLISTTSWLSCRCGGVLLRWPFFRTSSLGGCFCMSPFPHSTTFVFILIFYSSMSLKTFHGCSSPSQCWSYHQCCSSYHWSFNQQCYSSTIHLYNPLACLYGYLYGAPLYVSYDAPPSSPRLVLLIHMVLLFHMVILWFKKVIFALEFVFFLIIFIYSSLLISSFGILLNFLAT